MTKKFFSQKEVEEIYGIPGRTLERWRLHNFGPRWIRFAGNARRGRGLVKYPLADLELWIASRPAGGFKVEEAS